METFDDLKLDRYINKAFWKRAWEDQKCMTGFWKLRRHNKECM